MVNYDFNANKGALARKNISVLIKFSSLAKPKSVKVISPDFKGGKELKFNYVAGDLKFVVPKLEIWDVLVIE